jgi:hypothetical protein
MAKKLKRKKNTKGNVRGVYQFGDNMTDEDKKKKRMERKKERQRRKKGR